jgi:hypothetical protein
MMKNEVHQHPDGFVFVRTSEGVYGDTPENFAKDFSVMLPPLPEGADERIYTSNTRHAIMSQERGVIDGGPIPWPLGDEIIAKIETGLQAQKNRQPPPSLGQVNAFPPEVQAQIDKVEARKKLFLMPELVKVLKTEHPGDLDKYLDETDTKDVLKAILRILAIIAVRL